MNLYLINILLALAWAIITGSFGLANLVPEIDLRHTGGNTTAKAKSAPKAKTTRKKTAKPADGTPGPKAVSDLFKI